MKRTQILRFMGLTPFTRQLVQRIPQPRAPWIVLILLLSSLAILCFLTSAWAFAVPRVGRNYPEWAWRYGTAQMQRYAAQILITRIKPGMSYPEVLNILGPGSSEWPRLKDHKLQPEETISFNVRSWYNNGIDVGFRDGRVVSTFYYD